MLPIKFKSTLFNAIAYSLLGAGWLALGLTEHHGLARWERIGLSLVFFVAGACQFVGVWRRRTR